MVTQGKDILSSDLDIFGEGTDDDTNNAGDEYDIFWGATDIEATTQEWTEAWTTEWTTEWTGEWTDTTEWITDGTQKTDTGTNEWGEEEVLDIDIENLFSEIDDKTGWNPELEKLVDSLRDEISSITTDRNILQKENNILNEKLMSRVWDDSNLWIYKWIITNLESNPKLMMLVKHLWNTDSDTIKQKLTWVVTDILFDLTWEDVSDLINKDQSSKILSSTWKSSSSSIAEVK